MKFMIKLCYKSMRDNAFAQAIIKLTQYPGFPTKTSLKIAKIKKAIDAEKDLVQDEFIRLVKLHADLDEKGNILPHNDQPGTYHITDEKNEAWNKALKDFEEASFDIQQNPLTIDELEGVRLSPADIIALECLLADDIPVIQAVSDTGPQVQA